MLPFPAVTVRTKRIYDPPERSDGYRVLVDRLWPRGISKQRAKLDEWAKELAPSDELRKRFHRKRESWDEFRSAYRAELEDHPNTLDHLRKRARKKRVTLLYAARDTERNNAVVLAELLEKR